jgi:outer membrane protein TolC
VRAIRSQGRPTLSLFGDGGAFYNTYWENLWTATRSEFRSSFPCSRILPTFNVKRAERQQEQAVGELRQLEQAVALDVWTAYYALETAHPEAQDDRRPAAQRHPVIRSRPGPVTSSGEWGTSSTTVTAQRTLEDARAQKVRAKADWFLSMAQLIRAVGQLDEESGRLVPGPVNDPGLKPAVNQ